MKFKKCSDVGNVYEFDIIEFIEFNYDGKGSAIVKNDGELMTYKLVDVNQIMFGVPGTGEKWYELEEQESE